MEGNLVFLFAAVLVTWLGVFVYLLLLSGRIGALRRELDSLRRREGWQEGGDADPG